MYKLNDTIIIDSDGVVQNVTSQHDSAAWIAGTSTDQSVISPQLLKTALDEGAFAGGGNTLYNQNTMPTEDSAANGHLWWIPSLDELYIRADSDWWALDINPYTVPRTNALDVGMILGGRYSGQYLTAIYYFNISTLGNASRSDLNQLPQGGLGMSSTSNGTLLAISSGYRVATNTYDGDFLSLNVYTQAGAVWEGELSTLGRFSSCAFSNGTRGVYAGGLSPTYVNTMDYITIATMGSLTDFGDLTETIGYAAGVSNASRGVRAGGLGSSKSNVMDYVTISSTGNATDFGDLAAATTGMAGVYSNTRGVFAGGATDAVVHDVIQYITTATTGNATDFGDLTQARTRHAGSTNGTRGVFFGGVNVNSTEYLRNMDYITIATTGNAADFGDAYWHEDDNLGGPTFSKSDYAGSGSGYYGAA